MNILMVIKNVFGTALCVLVICWAQHKLFEYFAPQPTEWAKLKTYSAYKFYKSNESYENDEVLKPSRQRKEGNENYDTYNYYEPPVGLFSSTWTHFIILMERVSGIISRLVPKRKATIELYPKKKVLDATRTPTASGEASD